jgi:hypothetical protein
MLKPGINECDNATYHGDRTYLSSSALKLILEDPYKFYQKYVCASDGFKSVGSTTMDLGSYVHSLILEPENTEADFAIWDNIRKGPEWRAFEEENKSKIIITKKTAELAQSLVKTAMDQKVVQLLMQGGQSEFTYCTELEGVNIKVRADRINLEKSYILDVKTTSKPLDAHTLSTSISSLHYDLSAALYIDCFKQINKVEHLDFYFIFINTKDSLQTKVYKASDLLIRNGRRKYKKAIKKLKELRESGEWQPKSDEISEIEEIGVASWDLMPEEIYE